ncbi:uncharacterized protein TOT_010000603 [Theileria orientalis strain Shintoku]|uniref:RING-type E3 ubiquitin transferase n=1 Tax=Theileria orientalis strain Shintoku TaxID=869250 RepID=J4CCC3_THEOR|nr:uncharacterized protein TOT_010000603 [Theileria orientalis strain Shintoku]BAM39142.1 uncharacterized protein TOT_010000603 [Theileria orientalis strain Shintoku]|eukprot:XP_009689443.1 uncharacterized protein TOT_010000603 [Theileria orientalis strain Shintoku]
MFTDMLHRYALVSHLLLACSIGHISTTVTGFYDIITHFLSNKTCVAILYNYCLMLFIFCCKIPVMIFIGQLTRLETEELIESLRSYLTDSILFLVLSKPKHLGKELLVSDLIRSLAILLAIKAFHILLSNRLSHMFEMEVPSFGRVLRVSSFIYVLSLVNVFLINFFVHNLTKKNTFTIWVIFELLGMMQSLLFSTIKFVVNLVDLYQQNGLVNKVTLLFYVELLQDMTSLVTFTTFMVLFFVNNPINIPIYMIIDIIHVAKNLTGRIKMLIEYRKLSKVLNSRFPVYTATNSGETCIICRDALDDNSRKIDCGHAFHLNCLKSWLFQHASCPSCRTPIYSSSVTEAPLIDVNNILYNVEQRVLIAMRKLMKVGEIMLGFMMEVLVKTWPFNKVFKRRLTFKNKICKVVLILSNKVKKQDSYECYFLDENNNMARLFETIMSKSEEDRKKVAVAEAKLNYESSVTASGNVAASSAFKSGGNSGVSTGNTGVNMGNTGSYTANTGMSDAGNTSCDKGNTGMSDAGNTSCDKGNTGMSDAGNTGTNGGSSSNTTDSTGINVRNTSFNVGNTGRSNYSSGTTPRIRDTSSRRAEVVDVGTVDVQVALDDSTTGRRTVGTNTPRDAAGFTNGTRDQLGYTDTHSRSQFTGSNTPESSNAGHNTPRINVAGRNTPRTNTTGHDTPLRSVSGHSTPGSQLRGVTPRSQAGVITPRSYTTGGMVLRSRSMPFIHTNPIGSITASLELNINVVNVIKRHRFHQLFFLAPNSSSRASRTSRKSKTGRTSGTGRTNGTNTSVRADGTGRTDRTNLTDGTDRTNVSERTNTSASSDRTGGTESRRQYTKERLLLQEMLSLLNEKETSTEECLKEIESNLVLLLPLFLASMGTILGSFTQAAILSVLGPENMRARSDTVNFTNITTENKKAVYMKLVTRVGETENIDISSIVGTNEPKMSIFEALKEEAMASSNYGVARGNVRDNSLAAKVNLNASTTTRANNIANISDNNSGNAASTFSSGGTPGAGTDANATGESAAAGVATPKSSRQMTPRTSNCSSSTSANTNIFNIFGSSNSYYSNSREINTEEFTSNNFNSTNNFNSNNNFNSTSNNYASSDNGDEEYILIDENLIKKEHVKFLVAAKDYSFLMLKLKKKHQLNVTDLLVSLQTIQSVVKNHL